MVRLQLTTDEAALLREVLQNKLVDLAREINRTDHFELKDALKDSERKLDRLVTLLEQPTAIEN